jgi:hypothetical protein
VLQAGAEQQANAISAAGCDFQRRASVCDAAPIAGKYKLRAQRLVLFFAPLEIPRQQCRIHLHSD